MKMKKVTFTTMVVVLSAVFLTYCSTSRKAADTPASSTKKATVTYSANLMPLIEGKCSPCHIPAKGGNKEPFNSVENVRAHIDEIIRRIQLDPTDSKFMPKKKSPLSKEEIDMFKTWKSEGTEKSGQ
jgi:uncharacterized membrane protein